MNEQTLDELERLLLDWEDGELDDAGTLRLRQLLRDHPEAQQRYVELQMLAAAMHLEGSAGLDSPQLAPVNTTKKSGAAGPSWITFWMAIAASLILCVMFGRWIVVESRLRAAQTQQVTSDPVVIPPPRQEATSRGVALVTKLVDVQWPQQASPSTVGTALSPGKFQIESGLAQIEFFCGATVVLQGPAEFDLASATSATLRRGKLRAQVPPAARGFEIVVDEMKVVDLGTEFGISVTPDGTGVHVFDGEVELHEGTDPARLLTAGNAVVRDSQGRFDDRPLQSDKFVDVQSLDDQDNNRTLDRYQRWQEFSRELREDPRLVVYFAMEGERWDRKLPSSIVPRRADLDGAIVGARRVTGRWPNKSAIEFKRPADRVRVDIPGEFDSLTLCCWVKIDSLDRWYNSLFLTDNYQKGEPHWQILDTGQLFFSVRVREGEIGQEHREVVSPPFWTPSMSGQWLHLATTYDVDQKQTTHYLNGKMLSQETIPDAQLVSPTRIGKASIGNWSLPTKPDAVFAVRNLNGSVDEFALFAAALTPEEILEIYESGKP